MTEQEAHDLLHKQMPVGSRVMVSHHIWSQSIVGSDPVIDPVRRNWYVAVTVQDGSEGTFGEFAYSLAAAVERLLGRLPELLDEARQPPPRLTAPSVRPPVRDQSRNVS